MRLSAPIHRLKRTARDHARASAIPLHAALDQVAAGEGFASWSLLASKHADAASDPLSLYRSFAQGDLVLVAARPLQGKTMFALRLALSALGEGKAAHFFSLDYTESDVAERLDTLSDPNGVRLDVDCSDAISADHIIARLFGAPRGSFVAVDYLQLLDQKRTNPPLQQQIESLRDFARERGHIIAFVCQIDRRFDPDAAGIPGPADIRLPNPLDLALFSRAIFIHGGRVHEATGLPR
ncbi:DNA helicase [Devosia sediminis]|uniref:DNA helicase n=1 Tax=Devosia sediminis TaxID=2798801 RepID=A0A934IUN9_9HYPH|nr:DNA helicase [Devosia sediminis]MBJ3783280.1 DNA helicase [Devosia sediminis]